MSSLISLSFTFYHNSEFSNANTHTNTYLLYTQLNISQVFTECNRQEFALLFFIRFLVHTVGFHHSRSLTLYHTLSLSSHSIPPFSKWCHSFVYWRVNLLQISLHCEQFPAYSWYIVWLKTRNNNPNKEDVSGYVIVKHWMQKSGRNGGRQFERRKHTSTHTMECTECIKDRMKNVAKHVRWTCLVRTLAFIFYMAISPLHRTVMKTHFMSHFTRMDAILSMVWHRHGGPFSFAWWLLEKGM